MLTSLWLLGYVLFNIALGIHNKWVLSHGRFSFPWTLTAIHVFVSGTGAYLLIAVGKICQPSRLNRRGFLVLGAFSLLYTINVAMSNISLTLVPLAVHQMIRSLFPMLNMTLDYLVLGRKHHYSLLFAIIPTIVGVSLAAYSEYKHSTITCFGVIVTVIGAVLASVKVLVTSLIMIGDLKLHPVDFLCKMSPFAFALCLLFAGIADEYGGIRQEYMPVPYEPIFFLAIQLFCNGLLAFFLNWTSFSSTKLTSPVTMAVTGNVKQAITIMLAMFIFGQKRTWLNMIGSVLTILGGCLYTYFSLTFNNQVKAVGPFGESPIALVGIGNSEFASPNTRRLDASGLDISKPSLSPSK